MLKQGTGKPCSYIMASLSPCFLVFDEEMEKKKCFVFILHLFSNVTLIIMTRYFATKHEMKVRRMLITVMPIPKKKKKGFWQTPLRNKMWPNTQPHSALSQQRVMGGITIICPGQQMILLPPSAHPSYLRST